MGRASVVIEARGHDGQSHESVELQETLRAADQQPLADSDSIILASGLKVFLAYGRLTASIIASGGTSDAKRQRSPLGSLHDSVLRAGIGRFAHEYHVAGQEGGASTRPG